jgi:hypothetical protein
MDYPGRVLLVCDDEVLYDVTSENAPDSTTVGTVGFTTSENPPEFVGRIVLTDDDAQFSGLGVAPKKAYFVDPDVALTDLGGSPPVAFRSCVHIDRILLARNFDNPNRIWFSPFPDPEATWDTTNAWFDVTNEIVGMASFQGVLLVFSPRSIERILGSIPPGIDVLDDNLTLQPHAQIGCADARSIVTTDQGVVFANRDGVYITTSGGVTSLTEKQDGSGISSYWRSLHSPTVERGISCGKLGRDYLAVSVYNTAAHTLVASLLYYFPTGAWTRFTNVVGTTYAAGNSPNNTIYSELYAGLIDAPKTVRLSTFLQPTGTVKNDSDGNPVEPFLRSRPLGTGPRVKAYGAAHLSYDMRDAATDNPRLAITVDRGLLAASTKTPPQSPLAATARLTRKRFDVNCDSNDVAVEVQQTGPSASTEVYWLEADVRPYDQDSTGQQ